MKNYRDLTKSEKGKIKDDAEKRSFGIDPFCYYMNNCMAYGKTQWIGSMACNLVYWIQNNITYRDLIDTAVVGWYINELFHKDDNFNDEDRLLKEVCEFLFPTAIASEWHLILKDRYLD